MEEEVSNLAGGEAEVGQDQGGTSTPVKKTIEAAIGGKPVVDSQKPKGAAPTKEEKSEDESIVETVAGKAQDKLVDTVKDKVKDKAQEVLGDSKKGKEELADIVIDAFNDAAAKRKGGVTVGQATAQVSTTIVGSANSSPVTPVMPTGATASAANTVSTAGTTTQAQKITQGAGRSVAPPTSALTSTTAGPKVGGMTDELLDYGRQVSRAVLDGVKGSKNIRMLGMASLVGAAGWIAGKKKDAATAQMQEMKRQNAIRDSLMSDG